MCYPPPCREVNGFWRGTKLNKRRLGRNLDCKIETESNEVKTHDCDLHGETDRMNLNPSLKISVALFGFSPGYGAVRTSGSNQIS